jgi:hypothetical protein
VTAQRLVASVNVNVESLTLEEDRAKLTNLKSEIERYVNEYDWTDNTYRYDIPLQIDIFFRRARATSFEDRYDANLIISNGTDFQQADRRWTFAYQQSTQFSHTGQFHTLTGMLDFYIYILLGQELDKMTKLGGSGYYQKSNEIVQLSKFSELFEGGWKERQIKIENLLSENYTKLRELEYFMVQAKQWFRLDNRKNAGQYLRVVIIKLRTMDPEKQELNRFYQVHHLDMARFLSQLGMRSELEEMASLDPANAVTYRQFLEQTP